MVRVEKALRSLELENGYRATPGHLARLPGQLPPDRTQGLSRGEEQQSRREGQEAWAERMRETLRPHFREAESWGDLEARLGERGVWLQKKGRGLVVTDGTRQVKASRIDRKGSIHKLEGRFEMAFNDWRDRVGDLREAVETYEQAEKERHALHLQHAELKREVEQARGRLAPFGELAREQRFVENRLQTQLRVIYGPERVAETQRALADLARSTGYARAAETLRRDPAALGRLAGKSLPTPDVSRREALATVPRAAESVEQLGQIRRQIAERVDRELGSSSEKEGEPLEGASRAQALQRMEEAGKEIDRLLPEVYRQKSVGQVRDTLKLTRDPKRTIELLTQNPQNFGRLRGRRAGPLQSQERKAAHSRVPRLAAAVEKHGRARAELARILLEGRKGQLRSATSRFDRARKALHRVPSKTQLLLKVARAAERVGIQVVGKALPVPREVGYLKSAARGLGSIARQGRALGGKAGSKSAPKAATSAGRLAGKVNFRVLSHVFPVPAQVTVVRLALRTASTLARTAGREMSR